MTKLILLIILVFLCLLFSSVKYKIKFNNRDCECEDNLFYISIGFLFLKIIINNNKNNDYILKFFGINFFIKKKYKKNDKKIKKNKFLIKFKNKNKKKKIEKRKNIFINADTIRCLYKPIYFFLKKIIIALKPDIFDIGCLLGSGSPVNDAAIYFFSKFIENKKIKINVDFTKKNFKIKIFIKGEFFLISILKIVIDFILDKNIILFMRENIFKNNKKIYNSEV